MERILCISSASDNSHDNPSGKIGRIASEEVIFTLIKSKCLPILLYGTEACPVNSATRHSLQFTLNRAF